MGLRSTTDCEKEYARPAVKIPRTSWKEGYEISRNYAVVNALCFVIRSEGKDCKTISFLQVTETGSVA